MITFTLEDARQAGRNYGHTAANWQEAQTSLPMPDPQAEGERRAGEQSSYDPVEWAAGFVEGWELRMENKYDDGSPMDDEDSEME